MEHVLVDLLCKMQRSMGVNQGNLCQSHSCNVGRSGVVWSSSSSPSLGKLLQEKEQEVKSNFFVLPRRSVSLFKFHRFSN